MERKLSLQEEKELIALTNKVLNNPPDKLEISMSTDEETILFEYKSKWKKKLDCIIPENVLIHAIKCTIIK